MTTEPPCRALLLLLLLLLHRACSQAWAAGAKYCECDIALTSDGHIVLCHDDTFERLALFPNSPNAQKSPSQLTLAEVMTLPLRDGSRPSLLIEVLRSALVIGGGMAGEGAADDEVRQGHGAESRHHHDPGPNHPTTPPPHHRITPRTDRSW